MNRTAWIIGVIACLPVVGVSWVLIGMQPAPTSTAEFQPPPVGAAPEDAGLTEGWELFASKGCVYCHGPEGKGGVKNANAMGGEVPAIQADLFTYEEFVEKLEIGVRHVDAEDPGKAEPPLYMPSWRGKLTEEELSALWAYLESFAPEDDDEW